MGTSKYLASAHGIPAALDGWTRVFEREFDYVYRALQRLGTSAADAEDLAQEVFLVVWRRRRDWDASRPVRPWLAAIVFRVAMAHRRRARREVPGGLVDTEDLGPAVEETVAAASARRLVLDALGSLSPKQRAVLVLHELDEIPIKEVAAALNLPLFTAYSRLRAARDRFAREIRRRQLGAGVKGGHGLLIPSALLPLERPIDRAPLAVQRRVRDRLLAGRLTPPLSFIQQLAPLWRAGRAGLGVAAAALMATLAALTATARESPAPGARRVSTMPGTRISAERAPATSPGARPSLLASVPGATLRTAPGPWASSSPPTSAALARGLAGYWRLDESPGTPGARDLSGEGGDCLLRRMDSTAWIGGPVGGALRLDGGGWMECASSPGLRRIADQITISVWVSRGQAQTNLRSIVSRQDGTRHFDEFLLGLVRNQLLFTGRRFGRLYAAIPPILERWFHVAVTADGAWLKIFVDGVERARAPAQHRERSLLAGPEVDNPLLVGAAINGLDPLAANQKLNGAVDEVLLYDRALEPAEVRLLADRTRPRL